MSAGVARASASGTLDVVIVANYCTLELSLEKGSMAIAVCFLQQGTGMHACTEATNTLARAQMRSCLLYATRMYACVVSVQLDGLVCTRTGEVV